MKVGDLVKIAPRGDDGLFIVLGRAGLPSGARHGDTSKFSDWLLIELATGRKFTQVKRSLEVVSAAR